MSTTTVSALELPSLERATGRLERTAGTAHACFDDLAAPDWQAFRQRRPRFLHQTSPSESTAAEAGLPTGRRDGDSRPNAPGAVRCKEPCEVACSHRSCPLPACRAPHSSTRCSDASTAGW
jgi:hypothetical protein